MERLAILAEENNFGDLDLSSSQIQFGVQTASDAPGHDSDGLAIFMTDDDGRRSMVPINKLKDDAVRALDMRSARVLLGELAHTESDDVVSKALAVVQSRTMIRANLIELRKIQIDLDGKDSETIDFIVGLLDKHCSELDDECDGLSELSILGPIEFASASVRDSAMRILHGERQFKRAVTAGVKPSVLEKLLDKIDDSSRSYLAEYFAVVLEDLEVHEDPDEFEAQSERDVDMRNRNIIAKLQVLDGSLRAGANATFLKGHEIFEMLKSVDSLVGELGDLDGFAIASWLNDDQNSTDPSTYRKARENVAEKMASLESILSRCESFLSTKEPQKRFYHSVVGGQAREDWEADESRSHVDIMSDYFFERALTASGMPENPKSHMGFNKSLREWLPVCISNLGVIAEMFQLMEELLDDSDTYSDDGLEDYESDNEGGAYLRRLADIGRFKVLTEALAGDTKECARLLHYDSISSNAEKVLSHIDEERQAVRGSWPARGSRLREVRDQFAA